MLLTYETGKIDYQIFFSFYFYFLILYFPCNFCMEITFFVSTINVSGLQDALSMPTGASIIIASILVQIPLAWNLQSKKWQAVQKLWNLVPFPLLVAINSVTSNPWSLPKNRTTEISYREGRRKEGKMSLAQSSWIFLNFKIFQCLFICYHNSQLVFTSERKHLC